MSAALLVGGLIGDVSKQHVLQRHVECLDAKEFNDYETKKSTTQSHARKRKPQKAWKTRNTPPLPLTQLYGFQNFKNRAPTTRRSTNTISAIAHPNL
jgi:hypothetical protein